MREIKEAETGHASLRETVRTDTAEELVVEGEQVGAQVAESSEQQPEPEIVINGEEGF